MVANLPMLNLPIYRRNGIYYLHTRINGQQVKRSLRTPYKSQAIIEAIKLLSGVAVMSNENRFSTYKIDLKNGIFEADGAEDHKMLLEALKQVNTAPKQQEATLPYPEQETRLNPSKNGLKLNELVENYFKLKKQLSQSTAIAYKAAFAELQVFLKNPNVEDVTQSDLVRFQNFLAEKGNTPRTIDNKNKNIKAVLNFAIDQNLYKQKNPVPKDLMTKKQKLKSGFAIFEREEIKAIFDCNFVRA